MSFGRMHATPLIGCILSCLTVMTWSEFPSVSMYFEGDGYASMLQMHAFQPGKTQRADYNIMQVETISGAIAARVQRSQGPSLISDATEEQLMLLGQLGGTPAPAPGTTEIPQKQRIAPNESNNDSEDPGDAQNWEAYDDVRIWRVVESVMSFDHLPLPLAFLFLTMAMTFFWLIAGCSVYIFWWACVQLQNIPLSPKRDKLWRRQLVSRSSQPSLDNS
eukprot:TRINITY_DN29573_c0_g1_i1.p1 TRINITY_DN29573_c0_g1~~TRINITY_DN29573_c0_g1_i1.p1  ORF type:complete len:234 (+),score=27.26 TRINITY_DN29573_c0_g1_i1:47-703(+)